MNKEVIVMKITIYELLGLVKDGKAPKKIRYDGTIYEYSENDDFYYWEGLSLYREFATNGNCLDNEVEIIEEDKKIKKIKSNSDEFYSDYIDAWISKKKTDAYCEFLMNKINDLIDEINNLKKEK